jgi:hypothetical protein
VAEYLASIHKAPGLIPSIKKTKQNNAVSFVWWHMLLMPACRRPRQEDPKFMARLGYTVRPCLKKKTWKFKRPFSRITDPLSLTN